MEEELWLIPQKTFTKEKLDLKGACENNMCDRHPLTPFI